MIKIRWLSTHGLDLDTWLGLGFIYQLTYRVRTIILIRHYVRDAW